MTERRARGFSNIVSLENMGTAREFKPKSSITNSESSNNKKAAEAAAVLNNSPTYLYLLFYPHFSFIDCHLDIYGNEDGAKLSEENEQPTHACGHFA